MFSVTYDIVTPKSAECGDYDEVGYIVKDVPLRDAIEQVFSTRTQHVDGVLGVETNEYPVVSPSWITVSNGVEYLTGAHESRSLHMPDNLTDATRCRIARLLGA